MSDVLPGGYAPSTLDNATTRMRKMVQSSYEYAVRLGIAPNGDVGISEPKSGDNQTTLLSRLERNLYAISQA